MAVVSICDKARRVVAVGQSEKLLQQERVAGAGNLFRAEQSARNIIQQRKSGCVPVCVFLFVPKLRNKIIH